MIYLIVDGELVDILTEMDEALAKAKAVIQAYADGYTAGSLRQPSDVEVAAALRYLLRQGLLREGITIMAAKFAVAGMCSAMAEALEKEES